MWSKKNHRTIFDRKKFRSKIEKYFSRLKIVRKKSMKKSMKNQNFKISIFSIFPRNFKICNFHWLFHRLFFRFFLVSKNIFRFSIEFFFGQIFFDEIFFDHIFRFKKSPRFQKAHLENCAMRPGPPSSTCVTFFPKLKQSHVDLA